MKEVNEKNWRRKLKRYLDELFTKRFPNTRVNGGSHKHAIDNEIIRIFLHTSNEDCVKEAYEYIRLILTDFKKDHSNINFEFDSDNNPKSKVSSSQFDSFEIKVNGKTYYITVSTGIKKVFVPSNLLDDSIKTNSAIIPNELKLKNINGDKSIACLQYLYDSAIQNTKSQTSIEDFLSPHNTNVRFEIDCKLEPEVANFLLEAPDKDINSLKNDFGEILGVGCLAKYLGDNVKISFPNSSKEKLIDAFLYIPTKDRILVSQKSLRGASPAAISVFDKLFADKSLIESQNQDLQIVIHLLQKILNSSVQNSYEQFADLNVIIEQLSDFKFKTNLVEYKKKFNKSIKNFFINQNEYVPLENDLFSKLKMTNQSFDFFEQLRNVINNQEKSDLIIQKLREFTKNSQSLLEDENYCKTLFIKYKARLTLNALNNDKELMSKLNELANKARGMMVQIHLNSKNEEFRNGKLKFIIKKIFPEETNRQYEFIFRDGSKIDANGFHNERVSMSLINVSS